MVDDRYELVRELGTGATGVVWEAKHRVLTKHVAIKFLNPQPASGESVLIERFRYEAQVSARLAEHTPHIVAVHDTAIFGNRHYIVMDLASGRSVESQIDAAALSPRATSSLVRQVGDALRVAHQAGIIHRDVKPANILIVDGPGEEPMFKLADFGVAKGVRSSLSGAISPTRTTSGLSVGSPAYMSPEQVQGQTVVDGDPDRWGLAIVAYEALSQQVPFDGENFAGLARNIVAGRYRPISEVVVRLPTGLDAFFAKAFARDKSARHESIAAMVEAFEAACSSSQQVTAQSMLTPVPSARSLPRLSEPSSPPPTTKPSNAPGPASAQRRRNWLGVGAALSVAALLLLVGTLALRRSDRQAASDVPRPVPFEVVAVTSTSDPQPAVPSGTVEPDRPSPPIKRASGGVPSVVPAQSSSAQSAAAIESAAPLVQPPASMRRNVNPSEVY